MQSILATPPTKLLAAEKNSIDKEANAVESDGKAEQENTAQRFTSMLNGFTDNKASLKASTLQGVQQPETTSDEALQEEQTEQIKIPAINESSEQQVLSIEGSDVATSKEPVIVADTSTNNSNKAALSDTELTNAMLTTAVNKEPSDDVEASDEQVIEAIKNVAFSRSELPSEGVVQSAKKELLNSTELTTSIKKETSIGDEVAYEDPLQAFKKSDFSQVGGLSKELTNEDLSSIETANTDSQNTVENINGDVGLFSKDKMQTAIEQGSRPTEISGKASSELEIKASASVPTTESVDQESTEVDVAELDPILEFSNQEVVHEQENNSFTLLNSEYLDTSGSNETGDTELRSSSTAINPILSQIEIAQKMDTQVTDPKAPSTIVGAELTQKAAVSNTPAFEKEVKLNVDNMGDDTEQLTEEVPLKEGNQGNNKLDNLISSLNQEIAKSTPTQSIDSSGLRTIAATASDRALQQSAHNTPLMQSTALQQPIELQSKHASAMIGERLMMMIGQGKQEVTIRLDPGELGSMHIKLQIQQDQLQVAIQTQVGQSRDIIEQNLPRLREQLAQQGINLGEATVDQQSKQEQSSSQHSRDGAVALQSGRGGSEQGLDDSGEWMSTQIPIPAQGIDYYA